VTGLKNKVKSSLKSEYPAIEYVVHPSRTVIVGRSQSGKTTLGAKLCLWLSSSVDYVALCSPTADHQPTWSKISKFIDKKYLSARVALKDFKKTIMDQGYKRKSLLIIDDCSYEEILNTGNKGKLAELFYNAVWYNISIVLICHKVTNVCNAARENLENLFIFQQVTEGEKEKITSTFSVDLPKPLFMKVIDELIQKKLREGSDDHPFIYIRYHGRISIYEGMNFKLNIQ
jgi:hypothetical protein